MLLRTMFLIALAVTLAQATLSASGAAAKATLHRRALSAARAEIARGTEVAREAVAAAMTSGSALAFGEPSSACVIRAGPSCALASTVALTEATPAPNATACPNTDCVIYLQGNDTVGEGRATVRIAVSVGPPGGEAIAERDAAVTFRTLRVPPYAIVAGANDATIDPLTNAGTGDDGGAAVPGAGTLVNVVYKNGATTIPANVWGSRSENPPPTQPAWDR